MEVLEDEILAFLLALSFPPTILGKHRPKNIYQVTRLSLISHWYFKFFKIFISLNGAIRFHCLGWFWAPSVLKGVTSWSSLAGPLPLLALAPVAASDTTAGSSCHSRCEYLCSWGLFSQTWLSPTIYHMEESSTPSLERPLGQSSATTNEKISQIVLFSMHK